VYPITARFCNAIALYGLDGGTYDITVKDVVGGTVIWQRSGRLTRQGPGWWRYYFGERKTIRKLVFTGVPMRPSAEITVTISSTGSYRRAVGLIVIGSAKNLVGEGIGGAKYGSTATPITYSYIKTEDDGTTTIRRRNSATNIQLNLILSQTEADRAVEILQSVLDVPVAVFATNARGYEGLNTYGLVSSAPVSYDSNNHATLEINVKGMI
jgi:hypothetical protein